MDAIRRTIRELSTELGSADCATLFRDIRTSCTELDGLSGWTDVVTRQEEGQIEADQLDAVLRHVLARQHPKSQTIVLAIMLAQLARLAHARRRWDASDDLWASILFCFARALAKIKLDQRSRHVSDQIFSYTSGRLHRMYMRSGVHAHRKYERESCIPDYPLEMVADVSDAEFVRSIERDIAVACRRGLIRRTEALLVIAIGVRRWSISEVAAARGASYEATKKAVQRAFAAVRKFAVATSPDEGVGGLYQGEGERQ